MPHRKEVEHINDVAAKITERYLRESAMQYGECALNLMMTCMSTKEVIQWLEDQAEMMREFG
ncbi:hypothetical protein ACLBWS_05780 [Brucellaceae bacterium D45D]